MSLLESHMIVHLIVRWLDLAAMVILVGSLAFDSFVVIPVLREVDLSPTQRETVVGYYRQYQARLVGWSLGVLLIIQFLDIVLRVQMMSGRPLSTVLGLLPTAIVGTHIGRVWLGKIGILALLIVFWVLALRQMRPSVQPRISHRPALLTTAGFFCLMVSLAGHAADQGNLSVVVAADWLHVMAVSTWVGGLISLRVLLPPVLGSLDEKTSTRLFTCACARFSIVAGWSLGILLSTGVYNVWLHIPTLAGLTSTYALALLVKLGFVVPMIGLGALGRYYILPELHALAGKQIRPTFFTGWVTGMVAGVRRLIGYREPSLVSEKGLALRTRALGFILFECILAVGVLACTAVLTQTMPPHVTGFPPSGGEVPPTPEMPAMKMD